MMRPVLKERTLYSLRNVGSLPEDAGPPPGLLAPSSGEGATAMIVQKTEEPAGGERLSALAVR